MSSTRRSSTGRILQVGSQHVSSIVYQKAKDLIEAGAIGELNLVEAWVDRNSAIGRVAVLDPARRFARRPSIGIASWARAQAARSSRCACSAGATTATTAPGVGGDLFVHLFTGIHFMLGTQRSDARLSPPAGSATGKTGATCPT